MTTKLRNIIYPKPINEFTIYGFSDGDINGDDKGKGKDKEKKEDK